MSAYGDMNPGVAGNIVSQYPKIDTGIVQEAMTAGMPVFGYTNSDNKIWKLKADVSKLVFSGDLGTSNSTVITVNGVASAAVVYATSHAATIAAVVNAIKALTGVEAVLDSDDTNSRTILVRTKGATSTASGAVTGGSAVTITPTNGFYGQVFRGILANEKKVPTTIGGTGAFAQYDAAPVVYNADIWAQAASGVDSNEKALVSVSTSVFATSGVDVGVRTIVSRNSDGVGVVRVPSAPVATTYADRF